MTDEEAAQLRERWRWTPERNLPSLSQSQADIAALLADRAALRAVIEEAIIAFEGEVSSADPTIAKLYEARGKRREEGTQS